uniref:Erythromycin esterase n=1 Tax=Solibacter usitatus (strain Ellin6076) TaxID=234267 RepID=Q027C9_SOLUE
MKTRIVGIVAAALWMCAHAQAQSDARATFQELYSRIDAAVAAKDQPAIDRLMGDGAVVHLGPFNLSLRVAIGSETKVAGLSRRSKVKTAQVEEKRAVVTVDVIYTVESGGGKKENRTTSRDTWERTGSAWVCRESERTGGESKIRPTGMEEAKPVVAELKARAVKLATLESGASSDDLEAFGKAVGDARIVALGEATHGTWEFYQLKRRLIEYLVRRKGFTVVAFEHNWPDTDEADRYVKTEGAPRPKDGMLDVMEWMRAENRAGRKLTWTGFDMQGAGAAADLAVAFLKRIAPEAAAAAETAYSAARKIDGDHTNIFLPGASEAAKGAERILAEFDRHKSEWTAKSSAAEWRNARHAAATVVAAAAMRVEANGLKYRDRMMAKNVEWLADEAFPGEKIILWAHNGHLWSNAEDMGGWLRERFGSAYYVVGTAFRGGQVSGYGVEGNQNKDKGSWPVAPAPEGSGDAILSAAGLPLFFLDLRSVPQDGALGAWLAAEHRFNHVGGVVMIGKENMVETSLRVSYDGLVFVEESHGAKPQG